MNIIKNLSISIISLLLISCNGESTTLKPTSESNFSSLPSSRIEVLDFHSTHRCITCRAIENNTKYTLNQFFSKELKDQKITLQIINVDDAENEKIAEKFQATGTALFLNVIKNGTETPINLSKLAFMNAKHQQAFSEELKARIDEALKSL